MSKLQKIMDRAIMLAGQGIWTAQSRNGMPTVRWTRTQPTPQYAREGAQAMYPSEDYDRHVFLTFVGSTVVMRVCAAPWVRCSDSSPPLWLVEAVLEDPELAFRSDRINAMRLSRRAGRNVTSRGVGKP
jgi:hypothetical protein